MIDESPQGVDRLPTLTEVVELVPAGESPLLAAGADAQPTTQGPPAHVEPASAPSQVDPVGSGAAGGSGGFMPAASDSPEAAETAPESGPVAELAALTRMPDEGGPIDDPVDAKAVAPAQADAGAVAAAVPVFDTEQLVVQVLADLHPRIDMLFQSRLREALAPALAQAADLLIREARDDMSTTLRELVQDAVTRALQRRSGR